MKRFAWLLAGVVGLCIAIPSAMARPDYKKAFDAKYEKSKVAEVAKELKCFVCHYGKTKKNRNDYGTALSKIMTEEKYKELKSDKEKLAEVVTDALGKIEEAKSVKGAKFGDLIKEGKAPGTPPEEAVSE